MLLRNEIQFRPKPLHAEEYRKFMNEYVRLGHIVPIISGESPLSQIYYIPHHAVIRGTSTTTHLQVVFNASYKTSTGYSLNDYLISGPKLQQDIVAVIM